MNNRDGKIRLVARKPLRPLDVSVRRLLVTEEISDLLDGKTRFGEFPSVSAEALIAIFCAGYLLRVSRKTTKKLPDLERLEGHDEVWSLCPRRPKPGWRLLGRFYEKDHLVLLRPWEKHRLAGNYDKAAKEVIADWEKAFGTTSSHRGTEMRDYISGIFRDVDIEEE
jgi:hypothetical protein